MQPLADDLSGSFSLAASAFDLSGFGAFSGVAAGGTHCGLMVELDTSTIGTFSGQITLSPQSVNPTPFTQNLAAITINLAGEVQLQGDFNKDGSVDAADYVMLRVMNTPADYTTWVTNFARSAETGSGGQAIEANAGVPEPTTAILLLAGLISQCVHRRRRDTLLS